ncbi:acylphosphatase [Fusobacterium sp.]|uniref:acylphosphatase n=1 Tax=Fusobacterium sp. TaxID=68766 RepID=UPI0026313763|nr:acylphosphatase [Fusobacterium sp.]
MKTFHYIVKGLVQHVGYRFYVGMKAKSIEVNGKVRNLDNGDVEVFVQSDDMEKIKEMETIISKGSPFSRVEEVVKDIIDIEKIEDFNMIY